jgi:hypothetical protein
VFSPQSNRIPVMAGSRFIEFAGPERVQKLLQAANVKIIRKRKNRAIVEIQLLEYGDDSRTPSQWGNPQKLSHNHETPDNPLGVWTLKRLAAVSAAAE